MYGEEEEVERQLLAPRGWEEGSVVQAIARRRSGHGLLGLVSRRSLVLEHFNIKCKINT